MARTKADLQREIQLLRKRVKEMENLLQQTAIKVEQLQGVFDTTAATQEAARQNLRSFDLPPVSQRGKS
jgi:hypothetical protein